MLPIIFGRTHMTYIFSPRRLWAALAKFNPTHIHVEEDPHSLVGLEVAAIAGLAARGAKLSFFIWDNLARKPRFPISLIKRAFTAFSLARASMVICGNREAEALLISVKNYRGCTRVLPQLGLDTSLYAGKPASSIELGPWVGYVGRLVPEKGLETLFEALVHLKQLQWKLRIVGEGPMREQIQTRWSQEFGDRLSFTGAVEHDAVPTELSGLDVFVLPSCSTEFWVEQFGLTLAQAMMTGIACIGSCSGAIPEVLGDAGLIVAERNPEALANALKKMLDSPTLRQDLGGRAKRRALEHFSQEAVALKHLEAFREIAH